MIEVLINLSKTINERIARNNALINSTDITKYPETRPKIQILNPIHNLRFNEKLVLIYPGGEVEEMNYQEIQNEKIEKSAMEINSISIPNKLIEPKKINPSLKVFKFMIRA